MNNHRALAFSGVAEVPVKLGWNLLPWKAFGRLCSLVPVVMSGVLPANKT